MSGNVRKNGVRIMSRGPQSGSKVQKIIESMTIGERESAKQIAARLELDYALVYNALNQRCSYVKDVEKVPGGFRRIRVMGPWERKRGLDAGGAISSVKAGQVRARMPQMQASHRPQVVAPRTPPTFRAWQPPRQASALRPGADDYRQIPSLYGGARVPYRVGGPVDTSARAAEPVT